MVVDEETANKIKEIQKNYNYPGAATLIKLMKEAHPDIGSGKVKEFLNSDIGTQLTQVKQQKKGEGHITATFPNDWWQFDIFDLSRYEKNNDGYKYIFACVDVFTRKAYLEPMKNKDSYASYEAFSKILQRSGVKPHAMLSDQDRAFLQGAFEKFANKENIVLNTNALKDHHAMGIIDNYAKRLKGILTKIFLRQGNTDWVDILQKVVDVENKKKTSALGNIAPAEAETADNKESILKLNLEKQQQGNGTVSDLKEGDMVRKTTLKTGIPKGTDPRWSDGLFRVTGSNGNTIFLNDGSKFTRSDLLKVPEATEYKGINPIRKQKDENTKAKQKENQEKEQALKEKREKGKPVINVIPLGGSSAAAAPAEPASKPNPGAKTKEFFAALRASKGNRPKNYGGP